MSEDFKHHEQDRIEMGRIYRQILIDYGDQVNINFLDPRNLLSIAGYFITQANKGNISWLEGLSHFFLHIKFNAIFIDGKYLRDSNNYDTLIKERLFS